MESQQDSPPLDLPRVLCLHGGGVNGYIFRKQCRVLIRLFAPHYRLVFADGPFLCKPHPDMFPVYQHDGPFRRWIRGLPEHEPIGDDAATDAIEHSMQNAMESDDAAGGCGKWVGLLGFSQGAKIAASVLMETQLRRQLVLRKQSDPDQSHAYHFGTTRSSTTTGFAGADWEFAVLLAGRAPLISLSDLTSDETTFDLPGALSHPPNRGELSMNRLRLELPTVHLHGLDDPGLEMHRMLLDNFTAGDSAEVLEWSGAHRVPIKTWDVSRLVQATLKAGRKAESSRLS